MGVILRMDEPSKICYSECYVPLLVMMWAIAAAAILVVQGNLQGVMKHLRLSERFSYHRSRTGNTLNLWPQFGSPRLRARSNLSSFLLPICHQMPSHRKFHHTGPSAIQT